MKPWMKRAVIGLTLLNLLKLSAYAQTTGDGTETHGGDPDRDYVMRVWRQTVVHVEAHREQFPEVDAIVLSHEIDSPRHRPRITGRRQNCDGITNALACFNESTETVTVRRARLHDLDVIDSDRFLILAHEAFRFLDLDDGYDLSQRLMNLVPAAAFLEAPQPATPLAVAPIATSGVDGCYRDIPQPNRTERRMFEGRMDCRSVQGHPVNCHNLNGEELQALAIENAMSQARRVHARDCQTRDVSEYGEYVPTTEGGSEIHRFTAHVECLIEVAVPPRRETFTCPTVPAPPARLTLPSSPEGWRSLDTYWIPGNDASTVTTATWEGIRELNAWSTSERPYMHRSRQGYLATHTATGMRPLQSYYHSGRNDLAAVASDESIESLERDGYRLVRTEGYLYSREHEGAVAIRLFWNEGRHQYVTSARWTVTDAAAAGFTVVRVEGYIRSAEGVRYPE